jgi:hypothetical protein
MLVDPDLFGASIHTQLELFDVLVSYTQGIGACPRRRRIVSRPKVELECRALTIPIRGSGTSSRPSPPILPFDKWCRVFIRYAAQLAQFSSPFPLIIIVLLSLSWLTFFPGVFCQLRYRSLPLVGDRFIIHARRWL